ncbi:MAG: type II toxin-antitoxin system VapC family toxin [Pirellulaceae bacterium]
MRLLLDTHTLLWFVENDPKLSSKALDALADPNNDLLLSPATYSELAIKVGLGKYQLSDPLADYINEAIRLYQLTILPIDVQHAAMIATLPQHHRDPFDRLLIAQAIVEQVSLVSSDIAFEPNPITRLW